MAALTLKRAGSDRSEYRTRPADYARDILGVEWTPAVVRAAESLLSPPYRALMPSANTQGKTHGCAGIAIWWFDTRRPAIVISTAPKLAQVRDLLWKEIRRQVSGAKVEVDVPFNGPRSLRAERSPEDFMSGVTARTATSFHGHHGPNKLFIFDEAVGIPAEFWEATESMFDGAGDGWLCPFNPTDISSQAFREYQRAGRQARKGVRSGWSVIRMPAPEHPNIDAELRGLDPPVRSAMRLETFERLLYKWSNLVAETPRSTDIQWPPPWAIEYCVRTGQQPRWWRPGPLAESRLLARFPSQTTYSVWSDGDWLSACREMEGQEPIRPPLGVVPEIGIDVARHGDDDTAFHVRCGPCSIWHEQFNGQDTVYTTNRARELAEWATEFANQRRADWIKPKRIPIKIDDDGVGGSVVDQLLADGWAAVGIGAGRKAIDQLAYPRRRDELWFTVAELAREGNLDLSRLTEETRDRLQVEAMAPKYALDGAGRRHVEPKDITKQELGHSPDGMDAVNLAFAAEEGGYAGPSPAPGVGAMRRKH